MKMEHLNLHGCNVEEALAKTRSNLVWCLEHAVEVLDINHGKGHHSQLGFSVLKQEVRRYLKEEPFLKNHGYRMVPGESDLPIALTFDEGHTLVVARDFINEYIGGRSQQQRNQAIFSNESRRKRKTQKSMRSAKNKRTPERY